MRQSVVLLYILSYAEYIGKNFKCQNKKKIKVQVKQHYLKKLHLKLLPALSLHKSDVAIAEYLDTFFLCVCVWSFFETYEMNSWQNNSLYMQGLDGTKSHSLHFEVILIHATN